MTNARPVCLAFLTAPANSFIGAGADIEVQLDALIGCDPELAANWRDALGL